MPTLDQPPDAQAVAGCFRRNLSKAEDVQLRLTCRSGAGDRLVDCWVVSNSRAPDVRYEEARICAIGSARFRVDDAAGPPVTGAEVTIPFSRRK